MIRRLSTLWDSLPNWLSVIISLVAFTLGVGVLGGRPWSKPALTYAMLPEIQYQGNIITGVTVDNVGRGAAHDVQLTIRTGEAAILSVHTQSEELLALQDGGPGANYVRITLTRMAPGASVRVSLILDSLPPTGLKVLTSSEEGIGTLADASRQPLISADLIALSAVGAGLIGLAVAIGLVRLRKLVVKYEDLTTRLADSLSPTPLLSRQEIATIAEYLETSRDEIALTGVTLLGLSMSYRSLLNEKVLQGVRIRALVTDPHSQVLESYAMLDGIGMPVDALRTQILASVQILTKMGAAVRFMPTPPNVGLLVVDAMSPSGVLVVSLYAGGRLGQSETPHLVLTPGDGRWFEYFRHQFERLWMHGLPISPSSNDTQPATEET